MGFKILALCDCGWTRRTTSLGAAQQVMADHRALASETCAGTVVVEADAPMVEALKAAWVATLRADQQQKRDGA